MKARTKSWYRTTESVRQKAARQVARSSYQPPPQKTPTYDPGLGHWISGFCDGESSFTASITGSTLSIRFSIQLRADDERSLVLIRDTLQVGTIRHKPVPAGCKLKASPTVQYDVRRAADLYSVIIPHFDTFPLRSKKLRDYKVWQQIVTLAASQKRGRGSLKDKLGNRLTVLVEQLKAARSFTDTRTPCPDRRLVAVDPTADS